MPKKIDIKPVLPLQTAIVTCEDVHGSDRVILSRSSAVLGFLEAMKSVFNENATFISEPTTLTLGLRNSKMPVRKTYYIFTIQEAFTFATTYCKVRLRDVSQANSYASFTRIGRFNHYICDPLFRWFGQNDRIVMGASVGSCSIQEADGSSKEVVNGGSHNYAGFYEMSVTDEALQRKCLESLPISDTRAVSFLYGLMIKELKTFFEARACYSSSTGYGANMLGIPAVAEDGWLIAVDEKSHNSIFTGAYASRAKTIKRFKHNDMEDLQRILRTTQQSGQYKKTLVVVEGLYSMDGTIPPLDALQKLKEEYACVLYVDEAHSFGSLGKSGRGCLELWNDEHPHQHVPLDLIDVRSAVLSKAVGGLGGFVCCTSGRFEEGLRRRHEQLEQCGESLTTATILMTLSFLYQTKRLAANLNRLRNLSQFCHEELERQGIQIYGDKTYKHLPMLPVLAGRPSKASELSQTLRKHGVVASPVSAPAVELWESRVRITLSASYTDADVHRLISAIVAAIRHIGMGHKTNVLRRTYHLHASLSQEQVDSMEQERQKVYEHINHLLDEQIRRFISVQQGQSKVAPVNHFSSEELEAGHVARLLHGVGSGSARWILGTFPPHLSVESAISKIFRQEAAITYPDSGLGTMSTVAGLCRPILGYKKHYFLLPAKLPLAVEEGLRIASKSSGTVCIRYVDTKSLVLLINALRSKAAYVTLYVEFADAMAFGREMASTYAAREDCTVLVNDPTGFCLSGPGSVDLPQLFSELLPAARILYSGSFFESFRLPGGYLVGDATLIEELRYTSRCYMFTTSPMPWVMAMINQRLASKFQLHIDRKGVGKGHLISDLGAQVGVRIAMAVCSVLLCMLFLSS